MPHSINGKGNTSCRSIYWWTSGFFPGILWYINEYTGDKAFESFAKKWTEKLEPVKTFKGNHDIGFMMYCSFGNAYRLTQNEKYKDILIQSAYSLATRFNPQVGTIKSWDSWRSWENKHVFKYPVIIDNMMNLELLLWASKNSEHSDFASIARSHADITMKNHFRPEFLNRLDEIIMFKPLDKASISGIVNLLLADLNKRIADKELTLKLTDAAMDHVIEAGYDPHYGARPLKRYLQKNVETLVAKSILSNELRAGDTITLDYDGNALYIKK